MTVKARHRVNGVVVSCDETTLRRLGPEWAPVTKPAAERSTSRKRATKKSAEDN